MSSHDPLPLSIIVPSHDRPARLRVLLDGLHSQTERNETWEVVVVHDSGEDTERLLQNHPLAAECKLRHVRLARDTGSPARQRNVGWRNSLGAHVAFTDDDCRPDPSWVTELLAAAHRHPGQIVQGTTRPDPREADVLASKYRRTLYIDPPDSNAQTCNIAYPREILERLAGFDERLPAPAGEDTDLAARAAESGIELIAAPTALIFHAVEQYTFFGMLRLSWKKWRHLPYVSKRHPHLRRQGRIDRYFWRESHKYLLMATVGVALCPRCRGAALLVLPYAHTVVTRGGKHPRAILRGLRDLPSDTAIDLVEIAGLAVGSIRYRTLFL